MDTLADNKKLFKVKDCMRSTAKDIEASTLSELCMKATTAFDKDAEQMPKILLDSDGTEVDDEEYFGTLDESAELSAIFPGERWIDPTSCEDSDTTDATARDERIKDIMGQLKNNLCNFSVLSDADIESLSNMDPNSLVDIMGKDFVEQLTETHRPICCKRNGDTQISLLKLLRDGAIFCSARYPEEAEAIDMEISRQLNVERATASTIINIASPECVRSTKIIVNNELETKMAAADSNNDI